MRRRFRRRQQDPSTFWIFTGIFTGCVFIIIFMTTKVERPHHETIKTIQLPIEVISTKKHLEPQVKVIPLKEHTPFWAVQDNPKEFSPKELFEQERVLKAKPIDSAEIPESPLLPSRKLEEIK